MLLIRFVIAVDPNKFINRFKKQQAWKSLIPSSQIPEYPKAIGAIPKKRMLLIRPIIGNIFVPLRQK